jgi:hypothetical protein
MRKYPTESATMIAARPSRAIGGSVFRSRRMTLRETAMIAIRTATRF